MSECCRYILYIHTLLYVLLTIWHGTERVAVNNSRRWTFSLPLSLFLLFYLFIFCCCCHCAVVVVVVVVLDGFIYLFTSFFSYIFLHIFVLEEKWCAIYTLVFIFGCFCIFCMCDVVFFLFDHRPFVSCSHYELISNFIPFNLFCCVKMLSDA